VVLAVSGSTGTRHRLVPRAVCRIGSPAVSCGADLAAWSLIATLTGPAQLFSGPSEGAPKVAVGTSWPSAVSFPVVATERDGWAEIRLISRQVGALAWIPPATYVLTRTQYHVVVDISQRRLLLFERARLALRAPAEVGAPGYPTPTGRYFVALFELPPVPAYSAFVIITSALSATETNWEEQGQPVLSITSDVNAASVIGTSGAAVTHGGISLYVSDLERLRPLPLGTPIDIVAYLRPRASAARSTSTSAASAKADSTQPTVHPGGS